MNESTLHASDKGVGALCLFLSGTGKSEINDGHDCGEREHGGEPDFEPVVEFGRVASHFFGDGDRFERGVRDLLAFFGNAHFFPECGFGAPGAQLNVNAGDKLTGIDGTRNGIVGADIERGGAFGGRGTDDENHADGFRRDCTSDGRYGFSRDRVRQACVEYEHIGVRVLDGVEAFGGGGE